jgi:hypothetical protein
MSDELRGKRWSWLQIAVAILATYIVTGCVLITLEGIGWLNPILARALRPVFLPFLWAVWTLPALHNLFDVYVKWLRTFR